MHHWSDRKIRIHAFYCMLGISLTQYVHKQAQTAGDGISVEPLIDPGLGASGNAMWGGHVHPVGGPNYQCFQSPQPLVFRFSFHPSIPGKLLFSL